MNNSLFKKIFFFLRFHRPPFSFVEYFFVWTRLSGNQFISQKVKCDHNSKDHPTAPLKRKLEEFIVVTSVIKLELDLLVQKTQVMPRNADVTGQAPNINSQLSNPL